MKSERRMPVWPLLAAVLVLFVLSVRAPREWQRVAIAPLAEPAPARPVAAGASRQPILPALAAPLPPLAPRWEAEVASPTIWVASAAELAPQPVAVSKVDGGRAAPAATRPRRGPAEPLAQPVQTRLTDAREPAPVVQSPVNLVVSPRPAEIGPPVARLYDSSAGSADTELPQSSQQQAAAGTRLRPAAVDETPPHLARLEPALQRRITDARSIRSWPTAPDMDARLEALGQAAPEHAAWCRDVAGELQTLSRFDTLAADAVGQSLARLQQLVAGGQAAAEQTVDPSIRNDLARCVHALRRRLGVWQRIHDVTAAEDFPVSLTISGALHLPAVLDTLEEKLRNNKHSAGWKTYLQTAQARQVIAASDQFDTARARQLAQQILRRMEYARLTPQQRQFLQQPEFLAYSQGLKHLAAEPVDYFRLLQELEEYELQGTPERAGWLAATQQDLRWSQEEPVVRLGQELDAHYRNANVRLAISADLINRLLPASQPLQQPIDETIMGVRARGCSETITRLRVVMLPGEGAWQMRLQADGEVASRTYAAQGPARFFTRGLSRFAADKQLTLHPGGIRQQSTEVVANSRTGLAGLQTGVDAIPLLGDLVQVLAARQYESRAPVAESIAENRLAWYVGEKIDEQVREAIEQLQERFVNHVYGPMQQLQVNPVALEMRTTQQRMIARYRLAGHHQLAAHTPRPLAPGNSLLSFQIHESALNNVIEQFGWQGRRVNLHDVYRELAELFALPEIKPPADLPDDVMIRFADRNPLRIALDEDRMSITLGLAELSQGRNRWKNFVVRVHYRPASGLPRADLVRDQYVELMGRLALRDQIALRGIFSRVFSREQPIDLISRRLAEDPRLAGLAVTQMEIGDGWLAVAIAPAAAPSVAGRGSAGHCANLLVR